jgi:hypothetical protein
MVQQAGLSPSQREQVIQALLAERRSRLQSEQQPAPAAPKVCAAEREQRLQQLIQQRQQAASQGEQDMFQPPCTHLMMPSNSMWHEPLLV